MPADDRLIVALDVPNVVQGLDLVARIGDAASFYKIGLGMLTGGGLALANELKHEQGKRIFLDGRVNNSEISGCYRRAAVLVNPSLSEAFGMSLVEAMMYRVPVVASRVGGMTNIVLDGRTGLLVEPAYRRLVIVLIKLAAYEIKAAIMRCYRAGA